MIHPHRVVVHTDLAALAANHARLQDAVGPDTAIWPVVKADAYGHGAAMVAPLLERLGAERLCVACLSELEDLRAARVRVPVVVLGPVDASDLDRIRDLDGEVTITHPELLHAVLERATPEHPIRLHLKVDTGMGRWGLDPTAALAALEQLAIERGQGPTVVGVMTHLATADEDDLTFAHEQLQRFAPVAAATRQLLPEARLHAANSAAALRIPEARMDAVRPGVALYGLDPCQADPHRWGLVPVLGMTSRIAAIRTLAAGESTGYGRAHVATGTERIALVPAGYADGIARLLSARGEVLVAGRRQPIAGTVSMDHVSVLLDDDLDVGPGEPVVLIGSQQDQEVTAEQHAAWAGTINYEVTCGIARAPRLHRTVLGGADGDA